MGTALEFRVILNAHEEGAVGQLRRSRPGSRRGTDREGQSGSLQDVAVVVVELVAVAVALGDKLGAIAARHGRAGLDAAGVSAQTQRAALVDVVALTGHKVDDLVPAQLVKFAGIGIRNARHVAGRTQSRRSAYQGRCRNRARFCSRAYLRGQNHSLNAPAAEAAGNDDAVQMDSFSSTVSSVSVSESIHWMSDHGVQGVARMAQSFRHGEIGVVQTGTYLPTRPMVYPCLLRF